jgi:hypothetical protein
VQRRGDDEPEVLMGGVANAGAVLRIGDEVRRPVGPHVEPIHDHLLALRNAGFDGVPRPLGFDEQGRERLEFIAGDVAVPPYPAWVQADDALRSLGALMRRFHETSRRVGAASGPWSDEMADPAGGPIVCHNDVCLENVVFRDGLAVALLDFDFAAPGRPLYDLAQCARMCVPIDDPVNAGRQGWVAEDRARRLRTFVDAYGLDAEERIELLEIVGVSMARGGEFVRRRVEAGDPPFVAMWNEMGGQERFDRRRRWFEAEHASFVAAMAKGGVEPDAR